MISRSIVVPESTLLLYAYPRIGYHSILPTSEVTASSQETNNPVNLIYDYLTFDAWQATAGGTQYIEIESDMAEMVDYVGISSHNLATAGASFRLQYYGDAGWTDVMDDFLPIYNSPFMFEFDPVVSSRFRLLISGARQAPYIGVLFVGQIMHFERGVFVGHAPATYTRVDDILNSDSETGQFLGRSTISEGGRTTIDLNHLSSNYLRGTWVPFQDHARLKPFFFAWNPIWYPYEVIYGWSTSTPSPAVSGYYYYKVDISMRGIIGPVEVES